VKPKITAVTIHARMVVNVKVMAMVLFANVHHVILVNFVKSKILAVTIHARMDNV
jgi:hypothetical protein